MRSDLLDLTGKYIYIYIYMYILYIYVCYMFKGQCESTVGTD